MHQFTAGVPSHSQDEHILAYFSYVLMWPLWHMQYFVSCVLKKAVKENQCGN